MSSHRLAIRCLTYQWRISISAISFFSLVQAEKVIKSDKKAVSVFRARIYKKLTSCRHHREPKNVKNVEKVFRVFVGYHCLSSYHIGVIGHSFMFRLFALVSHTQRKSKLPNC
jgi:hypothetical protein